MYKNYCNRVKKVWAHNVEMCLRISNDTYLIFRKPLKMFNLVTKHTNGPTVGVWYLWRFGASLYNVRIYMLVLFPYIFIALINICFFPVNLFSRVIYFIPLSSWLLFFFSSKCIFIFIHIMTPRQHTLSQTEQFISTYYYYYMVL